MGTDRRVLGSEFCVRSGFEVARAGLVGTHHRSSEAAHVETLGLPHDDSDLQPEEFRLLFLGGIGAEIIEESKRGEEGSFSPVEQGVPVDSRRGSAEADHMRGR